jgi:RNA polymerase sigma factor (sigma-70 family)
MVLGLCRLLLRDPVEAEDAAQQVFVSAHASVLRGSMPRDESRWLAAIARNECRARIHERMREPLELPELPSDLPDPLAAAIRSVDLDAIWLAIASLPRRQRRALVLRELGGLSYHELERALGVSQSAVESLLFRARQHVRKLVAAATPLAFRDDLARLIPGFDAGTAGVAARVVTLPVALKLATAAVSVGIVTNGAGALHEHRQRERAPAPSAAAVTRPVHHVGLQTAFVQRTAHVERHRVRHPRGRDNEIGKRDDRDGHQGPGRVDPAEHDEVDANVDVNPEPVEVEEREVEDHLDGGGSSSGPGPAPSTPSAPATTSTSDDDSGRTGHSGDDSGGGSDDGSHSGSKD